MKESFMNRAIELASRNIGKTAPNPSVGCVIVKGEEIIAEAVTETKGRPHAETIALRKAGNRARGATMYVTLEPCTHYGQTPPCIDAIIKSNIAKVIIACQDPDDRVNGLGITKLKEAGISVEIGLRADAASKTLRGFFSRIKKGRPFITLKLAMSLDGKIALSNGESKWITSEGQREKGHELRAFNDAIMTGIGTVLKDDPLLSCRHPKLQNNTLKRVILDTNARLPVTSKLAVTAQEIPTYLFTSNEEASKKFADTEIRIININCNQSLLDIQQVVKELANLGINNLLVEGGQTLNTELIRYNLVDEIICFKSNKIIGNDGVPAIGNLGLHKLTQTPKVPVVFFC